MENEFRTGGSGSRAMTRGLEMKRMITLLPLLAAVTIAGGVQAAAQPQEPKRIRFAKGRISTIVRSTTGQYGAAYAVKARAGQTLVLDVSPAAGVGIKLETDGTYGLEVLLREEGAGGRYEIDIDETGEYTIFIGALGPKPVSFTMTVLLAPKLLPRARWMIGDIK